MPTESWGPRQKMRGMMKSHGAMNPRIVAQKKALLEERGNWTKERIVTLSQTPLEQLVKVVMQSNLKEKYWQFLIEDAQEMQRLLERVSAPNFFLESPEGLEFENDFKHFTLRRREKLLKIEREKAERFIAQARVSVVDTENDKFVEAFAPLYTFWSTVETLFSADIAALKKDQAAAEEDLKEARQELFDLAKKSKPGAERQLKNLQKEVKIKALESKMHAIELALEAAGDMDIAHKRGGRKKEGVRGRASLFLHDQ